MVGSWVRGVSGESMGPARCRGPWKGRKSHQSRMDLVSTGGTMERMVAQIAPNLMANLKW